MLKSYTLDTDVTIYWEEELAKYDDFDDDDHPVCDLSSFQIPWKEEELLKSLDDLNVQDNIQAEGLKYIGYVAHRFQFKYSHLRTRTNSLPVLHDVDWLQYISRENCLRPKNF